MSNPKSGNWTRRRLLRGVPATCLPLLIPNKLRAAIAPEKPASPFSRFVDVAETAGLTHSIIYGDPNHNTYIVEVNGAGCAFFDYDNDGWIDIFILGGRKLQSVPP